MAKEKPDKIAIVLHHLGYDGPERVMMTLASELMKRGVAVDILTLEGDATYSPIVPEEVDIVDLNKFGAFDAGVKMTKYLKSVFPDTVLANGAKATLAAQIARSKLPMMPKLVGVIHDNMKRSMAFDSRDDELIGIVKKMPIDYAYQRVDRLVAVSDGVADSVAEYLDIPRKRIKVIKNPINSDRLKEQAAEAVRHPWFADGRENDPPTIVYSGRLTMAKDIATMLHALARVLETTPARLALIGEGGERNRLERLAKDLDIGSSVAFLGYQRNPHKYVARANLFAMSSLFEGFATGIAEALTLGTPAVSTDCPSGPSELLPKDRLAPVGDSDALAAAMIRVLTDPDKSRPKAPFPSIVQTVQAYMDVIAIDKEKRAKEGKP